MKKKLFSVMVLVCMMVALLISCQKDAGRPADPPLQKQQPASEAASADARKINLANPPYNLNVVLRGACSGKSGEYEEDDEDEPGDCAFGHLKFRQDPDPAKIISLGIRLFHLLPFHEYQLQRAVDPINVVDGNCTSTSWLTLGKGLTPQSIFTNKNGNGSEDLWRDVSSVPAGSKFDIHFQVIDAVTKAVVLTSDCYQYQVR